MRVGSPRGGRPATASPATMPARCVSSGSPRSTWRVTGAPRALVEALWLAAGSITKYQSRSLVVAPEMTDRLLPGLVARRALDCCLPRGVALLGLAEPPGLGHVPAHILEDVLTGWQPLLLKGPHDHRGDDVVQRDHPPGVIPQVVICEIGHFLVSER